MAPDIGSKAFKDDCHAASPSALIVFGDRWSLLIIRRILGGKHRFEQLRLEVGISRAVLADRLRKLTHFGVLERREYAARPTRYEYHLTDVGGRLEPVFSAIDGWCRSR